MHILGADGTRLSRYRDSGMAGSAAAARPGAFASADLDEAGALVADVVRGLRPDVVVTYDEHGGYGHPDHIQTHRVTRRALQLLGPAELPDRTFEILTPLSWAREDRAWLHSTDPAAYTLPAGEEPLVLPSPDAPFPPSVVDDDRISHVVVDEAARSVKNAALRAHETQVIVASEDVHALSNRIAARTTAREAFRQVDPLTWESTGRSASALLD